MADTALIVANNLSHNVVAHIEAAKNTDFSVVLFRSDFMLFSEKNLMKVHKNQWVLTAPYPLEAFLEPQAEVKPWPLGGRSLHSGYALRNFQVRCTHNLLCTKHFHGLPSASPHAYSLKSRYGKVRSDSYRQDLQTAKYQKWAIF